LRRRHPPLPGLPMSFSCPCASPPLRTCEITLTFFNGCREPLGTNYANSIVNHHDRWTVRSTKTGCDKRLMNLVADGADITTLEYFNFQFYGNAVWHYFSQAALVVLLAAANARCLRVYSRCDLLSLLPRNVWSALGFRTISAAPGRHVRQWLPLEGGILLCGLSFGPCRNPQTAKPFRTTPSIITRHVAPMSSLMLPRFAFCPSSTPSRSR
jgi:hypothetical protein